MVDHLLRTHLRPGISLDEGRQLLGEPEASGGERCSPTDPYQEDWYILVDRPSVLDVPPLFLRWQTADPRLRVVYANGRLQSAAIE